MCWQSAGISASHVHLAPSHSSCVRGLGIGPSVGSSRANPAKYKSSAWPHPRLKLSRSSILLQPTYPAKLEELGFPAQKLLNTTLKMSYPTIPAYQTYANGAEPRLREHPVLDFLIDHQEAFDTGNMKTEPYTVFHADDFVLTKSDGTVLPPGEPSWKAMLESYAPFTEHYHEARYVNIYERNGAWEMVGFANIYANLAVPGEKTKKDSTGKLWDVVVPGAFLFTCVKDPSGPKGFKVTSLTLFGDGLPVVGEMIKRGVPPSELGLAP